MYEIKESITEETLFNFLTEKQIMEKYLQIPVIFGKLFKSPLRVDKKPTAGFYINNSGKLMFKDFGNCFNGNCISVVMKRYGINYHEAISLIHKEMILNQDVQPLPENEKVKYEKKRKKLFVKRRELDEIDLQYWIKYGISKDILEQYRVTGLSTLWVEDKIIYTSNSEQRSYLYDFGENVYKAYFPFRKEYRFITNASEFVMQGYKQLPNKGKLLIVTKALKDVMSFRALGYDAIAPQAESILIPPNIMRELKQRFKKIVSVMDFDHAGVVMLNKLKRIYGIPPYMLTNGRFGTTDYGAKDISDLIALEGIEKVKFIIESR